MANKGVTLIADTQVQFGNTVDDLRINTDIINDQVSKAESTALETGVIPIEKRLKKLQHKTAPPRLALKDAENGFFANHKSPWLKVLGWVGVVALVYTLITAVAIISSGFSALGGDVARNLFAFASNPWIALFVGILSTVLIQSSTTTTAIAVTAVGAGVLPLAGAIPIILGANVGTTVTTTLVALGYIGNKTEFRRALSASFIHDFYNWLALLIFFPLELIWQPLERLSGGLTSLLYGNEALAGYNGGFNPIRATTRPVARAVVDGSAQIGNGFGMALPIILGVILILLSVKYLSKILKVLMVGKARNALVKAAGSNPYVSMGTGLGVTVITQSSTITTSILTPFAGAGFLTSKQLYPVTIGANIGTTLTAVFAAFAIIGGNAAIGMQAAFVHMLYNILSMVVIFMIPLLRPLPLVISEWLAKVCTERKWIIAVYVLGAFVVLPLAVILFASGS
jgi:sodium-dependent phosphate cotransporter